VQDRSDAIHSSSLVAKSNKQQTLIASQTGPLDDGSSQSCVNSGKLLIE